MENLRDQFVCGLANEDIRQRLFTEDDTITYDKAYRIAVSMEAAEVNAALVDGCTRQSHGDREPLPISTSVHKLGQTSRGWERAGGGGGGGGRAAGSMRLTRDSLAGGPSGTSRATRQEGAVHNSINKSKTKCKVCGQAHESVTCKFKMYVCRVCNQQGHLKKMCPRMQGTYTINNIYEDVKINEDHDSSYSDEVLNFSLNCNNLIYPRPYTINVFIEGKRLTMEIDTGSAISCISYECYLSMFSNIQLKKSNLILRYYTGESVSPVGRITSHVQYGSISKDLDLYVVKSGKTNLLGRSWINELQIDRTLYSCNNINHLDCMFDFAKFSSRYCEVFSEGLGRFTGGAVGFRVREGARPVFLRARPLAYALREPVERALDQMVKDGIITPVTTSDWAIPIVPVMKKDGQIRVCADFKLTLNKCLEVDHYPLPRIEELFTKLHGGEKFTKLDLSQAYAQFELDESKKYAVINTHRGLFMYNRLIYGLSSSPGIFQRKLEQLFADMPRVGVFLDDIILTGVDDKSHLATLHEVFGRLQKYGLKIKKEKCTFFADSVSYLGFVINKHGVHTCPEKLKSIKNVPPPDNVSELRSFLGLVMYYARFVPNISTILSPLYNLLRKEVKFEWSDRCNESFERIKIMLGSSEVLAHYSGELPLILTTDASSVGVGAVISHVMPGGEERPIAYASRVLNTAEKSYSQIEREALGIIYGVRKFHQYLYGRKFILRTDHKPLVSIFGDKTGIPVMAASRLQRWAIILAGYDYSIEYIRSERNAADALSRLPEGKTFSSNRERKEEITYLNFVQDFLPVTRTIVQEYLSKDEVLKKVIFWVQSGWPNNCSDESFKPYLTRSKELYLDRGCLVWGYRVVIPVALRDCLLKELHVGHLGMVKMKSIARSYLWWPGIDKDIEETCRRCTTCALEGAAPPHAPPRPWPYVNEPWSRLHVDFLGPFNGRTFLVILDSSTKWIEIFPMHRTTAGAVIKVLRETFARFGLPKQVVSDNGPPFSSREYADFMYSNGINITFSAVYHPSSNGAAENAVKLCKRAIKKSIRDGCDIDTALQTYLMMYRNVDHSTTGASPAMLLQRRNLRSRLDLLREDRKIENRVENAQEKQVSYAGGTNREFHVGDSVWARDYTGGKWLGGRVEERIGSRNYIITRDSGPPIKRHVDQVKRRRSSYGVTTHEPNTPPPGSVGDDSTPTSMTRAGQSVESGAERSSVPEQTELPQPSVSKQDDATCSDAAQDQACVDRSKRPREPVQRYGFDLNID